MWAAYAPRVSFSSSGTSRNPKCVVRPELPCCAVEEEEEEEAEADEGDDDPDADDRGLLDVEDDANR